MDTRLSQREKVLTIYSQRSALSKWVLRFWVISAIVLCLLIIVFCLLFSLFQIMPPFLFAGATFMYLFLFGSCGLVLFFLPPSLWPIVPVTRCWWSPQPILSIDEQGITIYQQPVLKNVFLSWAEIATFSIMEPPSSLSSGAAILLSPKDMSRFFVHSRWQRLLHRWLTLGRPRVFFHGPWFLTMPATELTSQIQQTFGEELHEYQLQIQKTALYSTNEAHPNKLRL